MVSIFSADAGVCELTIGFPGLKEAAKIMNIGTINQRELDNVDEVARPYLYGAMLHCAGGDAEITLRLFMEIVMRKIKDLNEEDGGERKLRDDFCFVGLDLCVLSLQPSQSMCLLLIPVQ